MPKELDQHLGDKLLLAMAAKGVSQAEVARKFGVKPPTVSVDWLKHGRIHKKHYPRLVEYFGLPYEWWFGAAGEDKKIRDVMLDQPIGATELACTEQSSLGVPAEFTIPLLSWVRAGDFCEAAGQFTLSDAEEMLPSPLSNTSKNTFALQVRGDSMDTPDGYREGEIVYIDPDISPSPGRDVLAKTDAGITLKRYKIDEEGPYLLQLNGNKIIRPEGPWHVCGVVVFSGRKR